METNKSFETQKNKIEKIYNNSVRIICDFDNNQLIQNNIVSKLIKIGNLQNIDNILDFTTEWKSLNVTEDGDHFIFMSWEIDIIGVSFIDLIGINFNYNLRFASQKNNNVDLRSEIWNIDYFLQINPKLNLEDKQSFRYYLGLALNDTGDELENGIEIRLLANLINPNKYY